MAGDKDLTNNHHRLSRLTAKLLRRPSTSSSAKAPNLTQTRSIPSLENTNGTDPSGDRRPVSSSQVPFEPKLPSPSSTRSPFARVKPLENLVTQSRVRSSRCSAEAVDKTCKSDSQSLPQPAPVKNAQERLENDVPVSRPRSSKTAPSSPPIAQSDAAADSTPVTEETKRSSSLRRVDEPESASPPKNGAVGPPCALSVRKSNSHSSAHRALNAVDESSQGTTLPSPLPPPSSSKPGSIPSGVPSRPPLAVRRQSLVPASQQRLIKTLLDPNGLGSGGDYFSSRPTPSIQPDMISRKIWVKRAGSSATLVSVTEEDLVDDLREAILKKYANSLGRTFDAPDILLKLIPREPSSRQSSPERLLGPEEHIGRTLDHYYPGGQNVSEALIIEVPQRRTPRPSPRHHVSYTHPEDIRPGEADEYFPPMHAISTPNVAGSVSSGSVPSTHHNSMSVITTGQLPTVPSPGSRGSWHNLQHRPKFPRQHTSSPTIIGASPVVSNMNGRRTQF